MVDMADDREVADAVGGDRAGPGDGGHGGKIVPAPAPVTVPLPAPGVPDPGGVPSRVPPCQPPSRTAFGGVGENPTPWTGKPHAGMGARCHPTIALLSLRPTEGRPCEFCVKWTQRGDRHPWQFWEGQNADSAEDRSNPQGPQRGCVRRTGTAAPTLTK